MSLRVLSTPPRGCGPWASPVTANGVAAATAAEAAEAAADAVSAAAPTATDPATATERTGRAPRRAPPAAVPASAGEDPADDAAEDHGPEVGAAAAGRAALVLVPAGEVLLGQRIGLVGKVVRPASPRHRRVRVRFLDLHGGLERCLGLREARPRPPPDAVAARRDEVARPIDAGSSGREGGLERCRELRPLRGVLANLRERFGSDASRGSRLAVGGDRIERRGDRRGRRG